MNALYSDVCRCSMKEFTGKNVDIGIVQEGLQIFKIDH
jgi:hypothetical protein